MDEIDIATSLLDETIRRLTKPYNIPADVAEKTITSIREAVFSGFESLNTLQNHRKVFLRINIAADVKKRSHSNHNWGCFRIEKPSTVINANDQSAHLIEFYLYLDR